MPDRRRDVALAMDGISVGSEHAEHVTEGDLRLLEMVTGSTPSRRPCRRCWPTRGRRRHLRPRGDRLREAVLASPFLAFAVAVHRTAADLATVGYVTERSPARQHVPVFDAPDLRDFLGFSRPPALPHRAAHVLYPGGQRPVPGQRRRPDPDHAVQRARPRSPRRAAGRRARRVAAGCLPPARGRVPVPVRGVPGLRRRPRVRPGQRGAPAAGRARARRGAGTADGYARHRTAGASRRPVVPFGAGPGPGTDQPAGRRRRGRGPVPAGEARAQPRHGPVPDGPGQPFL